MPPRSAVLFPFLAATAAPTTIPTTGIQRQCIFSCFLLHLAQPPCRTYHAQAPTTSQLSPRSTRWSCYSGSPSKSCTNSSYRNRHRPFHSSPSRRDDVIDNARNHYETLKVAPSATPAEIKKAFYTLSKTHHPDLHEASVRRAAAKRFMRISEAYAILSSPSKRVKYDREHMPHLSSTSSYSHSHGAGSRRGSYASTGPAGGRPASGLSRRRGTFTGPPPSFYRSGGWGTQGAKRKSAHEESTGGAGTPGGQHTTSSSSSYQSRMGGMGPGQDPFGHGDPVPHFDRESHERTGRNHEQRREARRAGLQDERGQRIDVEPERGVAGMFFAIGGVLLLSFVAPFFVGRLWYGSGAATGGGPLERKEKSRSKSS